jgi:transcriptional regulator with GAF, ATPase, and Fis domain
LAKAELDDKQFFRLGDSRRRSVDVRILAATNQDLGQMVRAGQFLEDLLDRLAGATIALHPLEDRLEDLPFLVKHFVTKHQLHPKEGPFSEYDTFNWLEADYLAYQQSHKATKWSVRHLEKTVQQAPYAPMSAPVASARVQGFEKAIQHAHANLKLQRRGDYPVMDRLTTHVNNEDKEGIGPTCYTPAQLDDSDCRIALRLCPKQKDAAKLLEIDESTVSRKRRRVGL